MGIRLYKLEYRGPTSAQPWCVYAYDVGIGRGEGYYYKTKEVALKRSREEGRLISSGLDLPAPIEESEDRDCCREWFWCWKHGHSPRD